MTTYAWDDLVGEEPPDPTKMRAAAEWLREHVVLRGGTYRNKFGELVTWAVTSDGKYAKVHAEPPKEHE